MKATPSIWKWNFGPNWPHSCKNDDFQSIFARSPSVRAVTPSEKSSVITNMKSTTRFPVSQSFFVLVSGNVVRHLLAYLTVQKWLVVEVPLYRKCWPKLTRPFKNTDFQSDPLRSAVMRSLSFVCFPIRVQWLTLQLAANVIRIILHSTTTNTKMSQMSHYTLIYIHLRQLQ